MLMFYHKKLSDIVVYMSGQNPDWSDTMEGHVVYFIIYTGEQSVYVCPAICGVCEHLYTCTQHMCSHSQSIICEGVSFIMFVTSSGHADS